MRVLVTGGAGYVGSHTVAALLERGDEVTVLDTLEMGNAAAVGPARLVQGDIADEPLVERLLGQTGTEAVVHFAAYKRVDESLRDPGRYFRNNVAGSLALLRSVTKAGVRRFVFSSSCAVYGSPDGLPVDEAAPLRPENPYGASKAMVEQALIWYGRAHDLNSIRLRYFNAAGAAFDGTNGEDWTTSESLVSIVMRVAAGRKPHLAIFGTDYPTPDGTAIRDYIHVVDLAEAHLAALDHLAAGGASDTLNLGTGRGASVREVVEKARAVTGADVPLRLAERRAGDPPAIWADASRAEAVLGWRARFGLSDILESAWRWHARHPEGHRSTSAATSPVSAAGG